METARDPFEELTSLYLGDSPPAGRTGGRRTTGVPTPPESRVTIAVCGHLPVMAGLWVTQYADRQAAEFGPTGLVRLEGGRCSIELLRAEAPPRLDGLTMAEAARTLVNGVRRWIVCVDDRDAATAVRAGAEEVVVLTSGDQIAVIEAFRLVKSAWARAVDPTAVDIGVVVVGADAATAARAGGTLEQMSQRHLDRPLSVMASVQRLDVVDDSCRIAFDESLRGDAGEIIAAIREALETVAQADPSPSTPSASGDDAGPDLRLTAFDDDSDEFAEEALSDLPEDSVSVALEAIFGPLDDLDEPAVEPAVAKEPVAGDRAAGRALPTRGRAIDRHRQRPRVTSPIRVVPAPSTADGHPVFLDLDAVVETPSDAGAADALPASPATPTPLPPTPVESSPPVPSEIEAKPVVDLLAAIGGLRRVDWPFATAPGVVCAVDGDGAFHLVCHADHAGQLDIAQAWTREYRRQIAGLADVSVEAVGGPVRHVVASHAPSVADLHRTGVRLHLLIEVDGEPRTLPLNDDSNRSMPG